MTSIALAEELLLLAYDDQTGKATGSRIGLDLGMAAAVLVDLALAGRIAYVNGYLKVIDPTPIGDPIADAVLARAAADEPHTPAQWLQRLRHRLRTRVLEDLVARGVVRDVDETQMEYIHVHRYPTTDPAFEAEIRKRLAEALITDRCRTSGPPPWRRCSPRPGWSRPCGCRPRRPRRPTSGWSRSPAAAGSAGGVNLEDSIVRPSVALVVATLGRAIQAALGTPKRA